MTTHDEHREALIREVFAHAPGGLTPQQRVAMIAFAADVLVFEPGHPYDRMIKTPLDDPQWQTWIGVSTVRKVKELARALEAKGVLVAVQQGDVTRYRFPHLSGPEHTMEGQSDGS